MARAPLGKISVDLVLGTAEFEAAVDKAKKKTSDFEKFFSYYGTKLAAGLGLGAVSAGFFSAVTAANKFNAGMANIASLMPGNAAQVDKFKGAIQDLSIESGKSTQDLTSGMYQVVSAFGSGSDAVDRLRIVTNASQAGLSTTTEALNLLSVTTKAYGDTSVEAMGKASDLAFKTVQLGQTTFPELASSLQNVASEAAQVGVSQEELFASFAATTGVIGNAAMVSTKMKAALAALSGTGKEISQVYEQLGVSGAKALIEQEGLQGAFEIVTRTAEASNIPLQKLIGSTEGISFATSIAGQQSEKYKESLEAMGDSAGTTEKALDEQRNGINEVGAALDRLTAAKNVGVQKLGDAILSAFGSNSTKAVNAMTEALRNMGIALDRMSGNNPLEEQIADLRQLKAEIAGGDLSVWDQMFGKDRKEQMADVDVELKKLQGTLNKQLELEKKAKDALEAKTKVQKNAEEAERKRTAGIKLATEAAEKQTTSINKLRESYNKTIEDIEKNKVKDAFKDAIDNNDWRALEGLGDKLYKETKDSLIAGLDDSIKSNEQAIQISDNMAKAISSDKVKQAYAEIELNIQKGIKETQKEREEGAEDLLEIEKENAKEVAKIWENAVIGAYESVANAANLREAIKGLAETGAAAAAAYTKLPVDKVAQPYIDRYTQIGKDSEKDRNLAVGTFATMGMLPPNISESIGGGLSNILFGGKEKDEEARNRVESFLEDTLETNVIFGEGMQANWSDAFGHIAGEGQGAFETLGTSIALLAGETSEMGGQIGFILAQNLNGNLDSARLLVQSLGIDAEAMGQALMDAALKGEMSWSQWASLQAEVNELTAKGLVGAGDLTGAWDQFLMTGGKGQMALSALQSVAIEASEAGATSVGQMQALMQKLGMSQEEINRFVSTLQANGINSMEDLENASNETLGQIVGGLENAGQQWDEYGEGIQSAIDQMSELEKKVHGIQDKEIDLTVNVKYKTVEGTIPSALGNIFEGAERFALGGVVNKPTYFSFGGGFMNGLMGEAGPEAVMPLKRDSRGRLGVIAQGSGMVFNYSIDARGAGAGAEAAIAQAIKSAHRSAVRDSVAAVSEAMKRGAI